MNLFVHLGRNTNVDYTEQILRDVLCRGIVEPDIQLELLGHTNQDMKLEEVFHFVETKEAGKRSTTHLYDNQAAAVKSTYARNKKDNLKPSNGSNSQHSPSKCSYCGLPGYGLNSSVQVRKGSCPAYNHTYGYCQRLNHFDHVCRSKERFKREKSTTPNLSAPIEESGTLSVSYTHLTLPTICSV